MRSVRTALATLALAGCRAAPPMSMMAPRSDVAHAIYDLFLGIIGVDVFILIVVGVMLVLGLVRYSKRTGLGTSVDERTQLRLEITWTVVPALIIVGIAVPTVRMTFREQGPPPADALVVRVTGHQWWWDVEYPALGVRTANEIHLPVGRAVRFELESADVIHSFWVPQLGGKRDVIPGQTNVITFVPNTVGTYRGQCAEFCGTSHANMRMLVMVDPQAAFAGWTEAQRAPAHAVPAFPETPAAAGARLYAQSSCTPCHTLGSLSNGRFGPDLTHFASRTTLAGGTLANTPANVAAWLRDPEGQKPGAKMPSLGLADAEIADLTAYLESLE